MFKRTMTAFGFALACSTPAHTPTAAQPIAWHRFTPAAFEEARRENKLVMVDAGIEGCTACRWMHEGAYRDGSVIKRIHDGFVAVSVDADQEPDLGDRFLPWGWPATIFFTPDGRQVYALQGSESGADFAKLLDELVLQKKNGTLGTHVSESGRGESNTNLAAACIDTKKRLAEMSDAWGWGGTERVALFGAFEQGVIRARSRGESDIAAKVDAMAEGEAKLLDPKQGGIYVGSWGKDWDNAIPEKRTIFEAAALDAFALELHRTGDAKWKTRADLVRKYLEEQMLSPRGTFYSTQQDIGPIDHGVYTDQNAMAIEAYVRFFEATGDASALSIATRAADEISKTRSRPDGGVDQGEESAELGTDRRLRPTKPNSRLYLKAQGEMGLALLTLHEATGEDRWLDAARKIAKAIATLEDSKTGGFAGTTARDTDALVGQRKPFMDNVAAARFLMRLGALQRDDAMRATVDRTLAYLGPQVRFESAWGTGALALAFEERLLGPVEITIVRGGDDALAKKMRDEMARVYEPRKIVRLEAAGHYPKPKTGAAIYVCTPVACSSPAATVEAARQNVERMTLAQNAACQ